MTRITYLSVCACLCIFLVQAQVPSILLLFVSIRLALFCLIAGNETGLKPHINLKVQTSENDVFLVAFKILLD